jgi:hypothetical protein
MNGIMYLYEVVGNFYALENCQEMKDTSTLILEEEKNNLIKNVNDTSNHTVHRDFTLEPLTRKTNIPLRVMLSCCLIQSE